MIAFDSSVLVALASKDDPHREKAIKLFTTLLPDDFLLFDHIYIETLTVLRNKGSEYHCAEFFKFLKKFKIEIQISDEHTINIANNYFFKYSKLSFTDCMLMAGSYLSHSQLITFDKALEKAWLKANQPKNLPDEN